ncbi:MAG: hypothetical protein ABW201_07925 [Candidatus Thiodiazotropha sp.]
MQVIHRIIAFHGPTGIASFAILKLVNVLLGLRVDKEQEIEGLDIVLHEERGYKEIG